MRRRAYRPDPIRTWSAHVTRGFLHIFLLSNPAVPRPRFQVKSPQLRREANGRSPSEGASAAPTRTAPADQPQRRCDDNDPQNRMYDDAENGGDSDDDYGYKNVEKHDVEIPKTSRFKSVDLDRQSRKLLCVEQFGRNRADSSERGAPAPNVSGNKIRRGGDQGLDEAHRAVGVTGAERFVGHN